MQATVAERTPSSNVGRASCEPKRCNTAEMRREPSAQTTGTILKCRAARKPVNTAATAIAPLKVDHTKTVRRGLCPSVSRSTKQPTMPNMQKIASSRNIRRRIGTVRA